MNFFDLFYLEINTDFFIELGTKPLYEIFWILFIKGGWVAFLVVILVGLFWAYVAHNQAKFGAKQNKVMLAIDIPNVNLQSPKAVENIFSTLAGAHMPLEWEEKIFEGKYQLGFSMELICIDGYVQYLVRTPIQWRTMVEAAIYSQYPDAEITEVEDYTAHLDITFPSDEWNLWGADLRLITDYWYPIRTWPEFEHTMSQELKDPLSALLEIMNKMQKGEQLWLQLLVYPTDVSWMKKGEEALKKLIGQPVEVKRTWLDKVIEIPTQLLTEVGSQLIGLGGEGEEKKEDKAKMSFLPPLEKIKAEGIARKLQKIGFNCKYRMVYLAKKEVFNKGLGVSGAFGAIKQFTDLHLNGFKPAANKTQARWPWLKNKRLTAKQNAIFQAYKERDSQTATSKFILNTEELATLFHFPFIETRAPLVKKIESKKSSAPVGLPVEPESSKEFSFSQEQTTGKSVGKIITPVDYDDDYFEKRFAKDKTGKKDKARKAKILKQLEDQKNQEKKIIDSDQEPALPDFAKFQKSENQEIDMSIQTERGKQPPPNLPFVD